jgi:hypothetical protein
MGRYEDAIRFLNRTESTAADAAELNKRRLLSNQAIQKLRAAFPGVPEDYLDYLQEIGEGGFRECQFCVYGRFENLDYFIGEGARTIGKKILCFGDNFSGDPAGFLPDEDWALVEVFHDNHRVHYTRKSFAQFIREKMLLGPHGEDLRIG